MRGSPVVLVFEAVDVEVLQKLKNEELFGTSVGEYCADAAVV